MTRSDSFVVLQRANHYEFETEYLSWVFNRDELLDAARCAGLTFEREFLLGRQPYIAGAPEQDETRAYLFAPVGRAHPTVTWRRSSAPRGEMPNPWTRRATSSRVSYCTMGATAYWSRTERSASV